MIKRSLITLTALITLVTGSATAKAAAPQSSIYPDAMVVDEIDRAADVVYIKTCAGLVYSFEGVEDWMIGDLAAVIMDDNGTPDNVKDDIILTVKYAGYID